MSSLYIFNSIWSFLGWILCIIVFFTAVGSYRMNVQQFQSTQKRISNDEARHSNQALTPPLFGSSRHQNHHIHSSTNERERDRRDDLVNSMYNSDEEKQEQQTNDDTEERGSVSGSTSRGGTNEPSKLIRNNKPLATLHQHRKGEHSRYNSQPSALQQLLNERRRISHDFERDRPASSADSIRGIQQQTNQRDQSTNRMTRFPRSPALSTADDELSMETDDDSLTDVGHYHHDAVEVDYPDTRSDINVPSPSEIESDFVEKHELYDDDFDLEIPDPQRDLESHTTALLLPTPMLTVYFEFSRMIREIWLQGTLKQQKFMLFQLIDGERSAGRISDLYVRVLQRLLSYYEAEVPIVAGDEAVTSIDIMSAWQHELGDRKIEDGIDSRGKVVSWMCDVIKRVAAASSAVSGRITESGCNEDKPSDAESQCVANRILARLETLVDHQIPTTLIHHSDNRINIQGSQSLPTDGFTRNTFVEPDPFVAREATLKYLIQSHSDRLAIAQQLCVNQNGRADDLTSSISHPMPVSGLTSVLHPVYATAGVSARLLNVELMADLEPIIAEIQSNMEYRLTEHLSKWTSGKDNETVHDELMSSDVNVRSESSSVEQNIHENHSLVSRSQSAVSINSTTPMTQRFSNMIQLHNRPPLPRTIGRTHTSNSQSPTNSTLPHPRHHRSQSVSEAQRL